MSLSKFLILLLLCVPAKLSAADSQSTSPIDPPSPEIKTLRQLTPGATSTVKTPHAQVELLSEYTHLSSKGGYFWLGLRFQLQAGWHTYWKNPGDSGRPIKVMWNLPEEIKLGKMHYPYPEQLPTPSLMSFGYHGDVMFLWKAQLLPNVKEPVVLEAKLSWLVCKEVCIPEKGVVQLTLPVGEPVKNQKYQANFDQAFEQLPKKLDAKELWFESKGDHLVLNFSHVKFPESIDVTQLQFFPDQPGILEAATPQKVSVKDGVIQIQQKRSLLLKDGVKTLQGVLVFPDIHEGQRKGKAWHVELSKK